MQPEHGFNFFHYYFSLGLAEVIFHPVTWASHASDFNSAS